MAEVAKGIIDIEINTGSAASELKALQSQINAFNLALNKNNVAQAAFTKEFSGELQKAINKTGLFTAETIRLSTAAATLDKTLSKGKTSLGQFFSAKFNKDSAIAAETMALAAERAKRLQTQFIATSGAANGFQEAIAVRPLAAFSSEAAVAAQRTQILSNMFKQGTTQLINFGKNVQWAGRQLMVGFTVPLTIFGSVAGKTFMDLEKQAVAFKKVYGDIFTTPAELDKNLEAVKGLASEYTKYGIAVKDTIGLAAQAAAAGRQNADLTDAVSQATRLATLGQMDQNAALETTISLQSAFRLSGQDLADTINFLNMVENQTVVSLQDIAAAIPRVAPVIQGLGGNVKDLTVFLAAMQEGGVDAAEGANALKSGLASLINPTKQATEMLNGMGINLETIIQANKGDLMGTVQAFAQALAGLDQFSRQQALEQVFGKFQYAKLGALFDNISRKGSQAQQVIATMGYSTEQLGATADKELKTIEESFGVQLTGAVERFKLAIAPIGQLFVQLAIPVVNFITKIVDGFNSLSDGQKKFTAIAAVIVGVVVPAVTMLAGLFLNLVGTLAKMTQGMALFSKGFITGGPIGAFKALSQSSKYLSLAEMDAAMAAQQLSGASQVLNTTLIEQVGTANAAAAAIANLTKAYSAMAATQGAAGAFPAFGVASAAGTNAAKGTNVRIRGVRRNSGGGVPGVGNTDTVPAMLTPGEFVINKEATKQNLGLLKAINDGKVEGYNKGGKIPGVQYFGTNETERMVQTLRNIPGGFSSVNGDDSRTIRRTPSSGFSQSSQRAHTTISELTTLLDDLKTQRGVIPAGSQVQVLKNRILNIATNQQLKEGGKGISAVSVLEDISKRGNSIFNTMDGQFSTHIDNVYQQLVSSGMSTKDAKKQVSKLVRDYNSSKKQILNSYIDELSKLGTNLIDDKIFAEISDKAFSPMSNSSNMGLSQFHSQLMDNGSVRFTRSSLLQTAQNLGVPGVTGKEKTRKEILSKINKFLESEGKQKIDMETGGKGRTFSLGKPLHYEKFAGIFKGRNPIVKVLGTIFGRKMADGGPVPGSGNKDTVPAMLTPGEFVVNKKAASQNQGILEMMNGGNVKGYEKGGLIGRAAGIAPGALGFAGFIGGQQAASKVGIDNEIAQFGAGMAAQTAATAVSKKALLRFGLITEEAAGKAGMLSKVLGKVGLTSTKLIPVIGWVVTAGLTIKTLNDSLIKAENAGAELSKAMYGSADRVRKMGEAFGRESFSTKAAKLSAERVAGPISQEAQQASSQYMGTESGKQLLADIELVKKQGGDAVTSLRNQLAQSVIAGVITPEEAKAIAVDIGTAMNDQSIVLNTTADLNTLLGPNGENLLKDPLKIVADISPKIDSGAISAQASKAYEDLNPFQKITAMFKNQDLSGKDFEKQFSLKKISDENATALENEAQARGLLNYEYQSGSITLEEYIGKLKDLQGLSNKNAKLSGDAQAGILGYKDAKAMADAAIAYNSKANETKVVGGKGGVTTVKVSQEGKDASDAFKQSEKNAKEFIDTLGLAPEVVKSITTSLQDLSKTDPTVFDKFMSGQYQSQNLEFTLKMSSNGLSSKKLDEMNMQLGILQNFPNVSKLIDIQNKGLGADDIQEVYDNYVAFDKNPDIFKGINVKDNFMGPLKQAGVAWAEFAAMPNETKYAILTYVTVRQDITSGKSGEFHGGQDMAAVQKQIDDLKAAGNAAAEAFNGAFSPEETGTGGADKQTLQEYLAEFKKLTQEKQKYLQETMKYLGTAKMEAIALIDQQRYLEAIAMTESKSNKVKKEGKKILAELITLAEQQMDIQRATAFLALSAEERAILSLEMKGKVLDKNAEKENKAIRDKQRQIDLNDREIQKISEQEDVVNKSYDIKLEALDKIAKANDRLAEQERSRIGLASALASGDIAGAANAASEIQQQEAQYRIEDTRTALEAQRQNDLAPLIAARTALEEKNKVTQGEIQVIEDKLYEVEKQRTALAEQRAAAEERTYLLQQKQTIEALKKQKNLTPEQSQSLARLEKDFANVAGTTYSQYKQYGGKIAKMANGGIAYRGSTEAPPAIKMNNGFTVPGNGMTDKVPAMLTPGEFVVRKSVADKSRGFLEALNGQVFPGMGGAQKVPTNNFLDGIGSPRYSVPSTAVSDIPVNSQNVVSTSAPMYNSTYNVNVNVSGTNASPDDIANVVMAKLSQQNRGNLRSSRY